MRVVQWYTDKCLTTRSPRKGAWGRGGGEGNILTVASFCAIYPPSVVDIAQHRRGKRCCQSS